MLDAFGSWSPTVTCAVFSTVPLAAAPSPTVTRKLTVPLAPAGTAAPSAPVMVHIRPLTAPAPSSSTLSSSTHSTAAPSGDVTVRSALPGTYVVPAGTASVTTTRATSPAAPSEATSVFAHVTV